MGPAASTREHWLDKASRDAIQQKLFELYLENTGSAFLEVSFPEFGHTVIYSDNMYDQIKSQYIFPSGLVSKYQAL